MQNDKRTNVRFLADHVRGSAGSPDGIGIFLTFPSLSKSLTVPSTCSTSVVLIPFSDGGNSSPCEGYVGMAAISIINNNSRLRIELLVAMQEWSQK
jgi:hypothetical protein